MGQSRDRQKSPHRWFFLLPCFTMMWHTNGWDLLLAVFMPYCKDKLQAMHTNVGTFGLNLNIDITVFTRSYSRQIN